MLKVVMTDGYLFVGTSAYGIIWDFIKGRYRFWFVRGRDSSEVVEVRRVAFPSCSSRFPRSVIRRVADNCAVTVRSPCLEITFCTSYPSKDASISGLFRLYHGRKCQGMVDCL
jgi:hypothetical protein